MAKLIEVNNEIIEFPDDMSDSQIEKVLASQFPAPKQESKETKTITSGLVMGMKDPISAGAQMLPRGLSYLTSVGGLFPNEVSKFFGSEAQRVDEMVKAEEQAYQQQRAAKGEEGFDWARLGGNVVSPANLAVGARAAGLVSAAKPLTQAAVTGAATGALQPVLNTKEFVDEKTKQVIGGGVGGVVGAKTTQLVGKAFNPLVSKAEQTMRDMGVQLTPGQLMGKQYAGLEEFAKNMPLVGSYISNAKEKQLYQFNKAVINKALGKVGEKLPEDVIGRDAVAHTRQVISDKYDDVLGGLSFTLDQPLKQDFAAIVRTARVPSAVGKQELNDLIDQYVYQQIPINGKTGLGVVDGQAYKKIESDLGKIIQDYRNGSTAQEKAIGTELKRVLDSLKTSLRNQNPQQSSKLRRIDSAYGDLLVMETAAANNGALNGVFTPKQYSTAVRQVDKSRSKKAFASGKATGQDISDSAMEVLGPISDSTLEGRLTMGLAGVYGAASNPAVAITVPVATKALYSDTGLKAINTIMRSRPEVAKKVGQTLTKRASKEGSITGAMVIEEYQRATKAKDTETEAEAIVDQLPYTPASTSSSPEVQQGSWDRSGASVPGWQKLYPNEEAMRRAMQ